MLDGRDSPKYLDFCFLDYYSKLIDMNKPIEKKKIIIQIITMRFLLKKKAYLIRSLRKVLLMSITRF